MKNGRRVCSLATGLLLAMSGACSTASTGKELASQQAAALSATPTSAPTDALLAEFDAQPPVTPAPPAPPDAAVMASQAPSFAVSIAVPPWTACNVYPQGLSKDPVYPQGASSGPNQNGNVQAGADGQIRFYPPPSSWGTKLTASCSINGSPQGTYSIDLNDSSTFIALSPSSLAPTVARVRPALTGDLSTIDPTVLLQNGYPPRPDPVKSPHFYNLWVSDVTKAMNVYQGIGVASLGVSGSGVYAGDVVLQGTPGLGVEWTGFVQAASGFADAGVAYSSTTYDEYFTEMVVPTTACYADGPAYQCWTLLWSGIGGYPQSSSGTVSTDWSMIQSGLELKSGSTLLYEQYWPSTITVSGVTLPSYITLHPPSGDTLSPGDDLLVWAFSSSTSACSAVSNSGTWACYAFEDATGTTWSESGTAVQKNAGQWGPSTMEYVAEVPYTESNESNIYYDWTAMVGEAWDVDGGVHPDPYNGSDPYQVVVAQNLSDQNINFPYWANQTWVTPSDPMFLFWTAWQ